jgi:hypothetical protein
MGSKVACIHTDETATSSAVLPSPAGVPSYMGRVLSVASVPAVWLFWLGRWMNG